MLGIDVSRYQDVVPSFMYPGYKDRCPLGRPLPLHSDALWNRTLREKIQGIVKRKYTAMKKRTNDIYSPSRMLE